MCWCTNVYESRPNVCSMRRLQELETTATIDKSQFYRLVDTLLQSTNQPRYCTAMIFYILAHYEPARVYRMEMAWTAKQMFHKWNAQHGTRESLEWLQFSRRAFEAADRDDLPATPPLTVQRFKELMQRITDSRSLWRSLRFRRQERTELRHMKRWRFWRRLRRRMGALFERKLLPVGGWCITDPSKVGRSTAACWACSADWMEYTLDCTQQEMGEVSNIETIWEISNSIWASAPQNCYQCGQKAVA